jgi:hypothetical protein
LVCHLLLGGATRKTPFLGEQDMQVAGPARRLAGGILGLIAGLLITSATFVDAFSTRVAALGLIPVLTIFTPFQNQTVSGTVPFYVQADSIGTVSLQFKIDGQDFGTAITAGSCRASWDSTQTGDGLHTIQAVGMDQFGNATTSQPVTVLVTSYAPPSPPAPGPAPIPGPTPAPAPAPTPTPAPPAEPALRITYPAAGSTVSAIFDTAVVLAGEIAPSSIRIEIRQPTGRLALTWPTPANSSSNPLMFRPVLGTLDSGPYDLVAVSDTMSSPPVRVNFVRSELLPRPRPEPIGAATPDSATASVQRPKSILALSLQTTGGSQFRLTSSLQKNGLGLPGVLVTFVVTGPGGSRETYRAITDSDGVATANGRLNVREPRGIYRVVATAGATLGRAPVSVADSFVY